MESLVIGKDIVFHGTVGISNKDEFIDSLMPVLLERLKSTELYDVLNSITESAHDAISTTTTFDEKVTHLLESLPAFTTKINSNMEALNASLGVNSDTINVITKALDNTREFNDDLDGKIINNELKTDELMDDTRSSIDDLDGKIINNVLRIDELMDSQKSRIDELNVKLNELVNSHELKIEEMDRKFDKFKEMIKKNMIILNKKLISSKVEIAKLKAEIEEPKKQILFQKDKTAQNIN